MRLRLLPPLMILLTGCATTPGGSTHPAPMMQPPISGEQHLADVRQLTFGGENAEAYFSFAGDQLVYQARGPEEGCDRIWRMELTGSSPVRSPVSSGRGATTCSYFLPGDRDVVFASTHLGGDACPPKPDRAQGYVWALYSSYDVFRSGADGSGLQRLTETPGYDAEATVCGKDGSIVFTSVRDGDLELYRMDADGKNVRRLTHTPGYDGGAFFNADCSKLVWRASRPKGKDLEDYQALLARGLVRPSKLELYVADADGSDPVQVTYLDAASFAPFWFPDGQRLLFSTNAGDPQGREFDLWMVNIDGTGLRQVTHARGFDGFPMFSPDGTQLIFGSNRANAEGSHDTNLFLARWVDAPDTPATATMAKAVGSRGAHDPAVLTESTHGARPSGDGHAVTADAVAGEVPGAGLAAASAAHVEHARRMKQDVTWLAAPEREGRGVGTGGLEASTHWLEQRFAALGLEPAGDAGTFRQAFEVTTGVKVDRSELSLAGRSIDPAPAPLAFASSGEVKGRLVLAGHGIVSLEAGRDDYKGLDVRGKVVLVRRFTPEDGAFADAALQRRYGDLRHKAWIAREKGAIGVLVVDWPEGVAPDALPKEALAPPLRPEGTGELGIPVAIVSRDAVAPHLTRLSSRGASIPVTLTLRLRPERRKAFNVVGRLPAGAPMTARQSGTVVVGAHYDHLGMGGSDSLTPEVRAPHLGADDNASGVAAVLEVARALSAGRADLERDVLFAAFSAEELGVLGSTHLVKSGAAKDAVGMLNLDMVGRLRANTLQVLGAQSALEWSELVQPACDAARIACELGGDGFGPSDHMPFYAAGIPVLHFFTGVHGDYHKPSDAAAHVNYAGLARVGQTVQTVALALANRDAKLTWRDAPAPLPLGDRRTFNASLGTIPDYAGPGPDLTGVLLAGVRPGGAAQLAGMQRGDRLVRLGNHQVRSVEDFMFALGALKPGEVIPVVVVRSGAELTLTATLQEARARH
jgi:Tol biopolymer transport system component